LARHQKHARGRRRTPRPALALALVAVLAGAFPSGSARAADPFPPPLPSIPLPPPLGPGPDEEPPCSTATKPFVPTSVTIAHLDRAVPVLALHRKHHHEPGTPPTTRKGKWMLAFDLDSGIRPGGRQGNALFNAHTWPNGSAVGNAMLADLNEGDRIVARAEQGKLCYQVTDRVDVPAKSRKATKRYFAKKGPPQLAIVVCSGKRLGRGSWTRRTIWYASPEA
jgi:hypothetical protein